MTQQVTNNTKTFTQIIDEVKFLLADGDIIFPDDAIRRAINTGLSMVHNSFHRDSTDAYFTTESGERLYEIPDARYDGGIASVEAVWLDGERLDEVEYDIEQDDAGTPTGYSVMGNSIAFDITPDGEYSVHVLYLMEFRPLVGVDDTTSMSDVEIQAGIFYACYLMKLKDEEFQSANAFKNAYDEAVSLASRYPSGLYSGEDGRMK